MAGLIALTGDANAYAIKRTSHGDFVHWEESAVHYTIDPSMDQNVYGASEAATKAMGSWSGDVGAPDLQTIVVDDSSPKQPGFDQKNLIFFAAGGYTPAGHALAITVLTYDNLTGRILDADLIVNGSYKFAVLPTLNDHKPSSHLGRSTDIIEHEEEVTSTENIYDLHHVVAHEFGHSLGMNDELGRKDSLMYRYSAPNDPTMRQPAPDDIAGLAELYSTRLEGQGSGCGSATVAPKPPSRAASHAAMYATMGLLLFLVLRARNDRRARVAFIFAATAATIAFVPTLSGKRGSGTAQAADLSAATSLDLGRASLGHARAKVLGTATTVERGIFKTSYQLAVATCHVGSCPKTGQGEAWGGTIGNITQEVGGNYAPVPGDDVDVSFSSLPSAVGALLRPLAGRPMDVGSIRVLTRAPL